MNDAPGAHTEHVVTDDATTTRDRTRDRWMVVALVVAVALYIAWRAVSGGSSGPSASPGAQSGARSQATAPSAAPAAIDYKAAINDERFHVLIGLAYGEAGYVDQALHHAREALRINPRSVPGLNNVGYYSFIKKDYATSAAALEQALQIDPASVHARNNLIETYKKAVEAAASPEEKRKFDERRRALESGMVGTAPAKR